MSCSWSGGAGILIRLGKSDLLSIISDWGIYSPVKPQLPLLDEVAELPLLIQLDVLLRLITGGACIGAKPVHHNGQPPTPVELYYVPLVDIA